MYVTAMGMSCPTGLTWRSACAAMRAGISRRRELPWRDNDGQPIVGSSLARLDELSTPQARWLRLLAWALTETVEGVSADLRAQLPVLIVLPPEDRETPSGAALDAVIEAQGLSPARVQLEAGGSAAGLGALAKARGLVARHRQCVLVAADSMIGVRPLLRLAEQRRLLTPSNPDGVTPGEAAAAVLLSDAEAGSLASILGTGCGHELGLPSNDTPLRAEGICAAVHSALSGAGLSMHDIAFRVSDAAGDSYAFKEQALMLSRTLRSPREQFDLVLPAESLGDVGAAAGLSGLVVAISALRRPTGAREAAMVFAGSPDGARSTAVVRATFAAQEM